MEVAGASASIIAIVQLVEKIISTCRWYLTTARDAPNDLRTIMIEVASLKSILDTHRLSPILENLKDRDGPLEACRRELVILDTLVSSAPLPGTGPKRRKVLLSATALAWPLKETKARKLLENIGRHKATIHFALSCGHM